MSPVISPAGPVAPAAASSISLDLACASADVRWRVLAALAPLAALGLSVAISDEAEWGLLAWGPVVAVLAAWEELQPLGEAVAVAPRAFGLSGEALVPVWA